jgi:hypothetical protein
VAKCRDCGEKVNWATITNGKLSGKKRPFDVEGGGSGRFGIRGTGEEDNYGAEKLEAVFYEDPVDGLSAHDTLYANHFDTCPAKDSRRVLRTADAGAPSVDRVFSMIQIGGVDYSGYLSKVSAGSDSGQATEEAPF